MKLYLEVILCAVVEMIIEKNGMTLVRFELSEIK
jgi:hypothetical protein